MQTLFSIIISVSRKKEYHCCIFIVLSVTWNKITLYFEILFFRRLFLMKI